MTPLRVVKASLAMGAVLLVLACSGPSGFMADDDRFDDSDRSDYATAIANATMRAGDATAETQVWADLATPEP